MEQDNNGTLSCLNTDKIWTLSKPQNSSHPSLLLTERLPLLYWLELWSPLLQLRFIGIHNHKTVPAFWQHPTQSESPLSWTLPQITHSKPEPNESFQTRFLVMCILPHCSESEPQYPQRQVFSWWSLQGERWQAQSLKPEQTFLRKAKRISIFQILTKILIQNKLELIFSHCGFFGKGPFSSVPQKNCFCEV